MLHIVHVISDLDTGGAEVMLAKLVGGMDQGTFKNSVVSLTDRGQLGDAIEATGTAVRCLSIRRGSIDLAALPKLIQLLRTSQPTLVQSWLYHADLLSLIAAKFAGSPPVVWNLRCSDIELECYPRLTRWVQRALALCSRLPVAVVVNSIAGQVLHERLGYRPRRWEVIPNGFDLERFRPDLTARQRLRKELGLPDDAVLFALVARVDPMKDHATFLAAASLVAAARPQAYFLLAGRDTQALAPRIGERRLDGCMHLLGPRADINELLAGVDIVCLTSAFGEGFPNVLGEAMAVGVPCVTTDVGDARVIVGHTGVVVPPRDARALAAAMTDLLDRGPVARAALGKEARKRIEAEYALPRVIERYQELYKELAPRTV